MEKKFADDSEEVPQIWAATTLALIWVSAFALLGEPQTHIERDIPTYIQTLPHWTATHDQSL